jgi:hypothetical protein
MRILISLSLTVLVFAAANAPADVGFRCGSRLIDVGDAREDVLEHCGEPTTRSGYDWIYERGPSQFDILVHFEPDGTVSRIENNPREK